jgi:hypothetical protein
MGRKEGNGVRQSGEQETSREGQRQEQKVISEEYAGPKPVVEGIAERLERLAWRRSRYKRGNLGED